MGVTFTNNAKSPPVVKARRAAVAVCAIASAEIRKLRFLLAILYSKFCMYGLVVGSKVDELHIPFHVDSKRLQFFDEEAFVIILGISKNVRIRAETLADVVEGKSRDVAAVAAIMHSARFDSLSGHLIAKSKLLIKFECPCLYSHRARLFRRARFFINDPERNTASRKLQSKNQASRTRACD